MFCEQVFYSLRLTENNDTDEYIGVSDPTRFEIRCIRMTWYTMLSVCYEL